MQDRVLIYIDSQRCDTFADNDLCLPIAIDMAKKGDASLSREAHKCRVVLPATRLNRTIFGAELSTSAFNSSPHEVALFVDGVLLRSGTVVLVGQEFDTERGDVLQVELRFDAAEWARIASLRTISETPLDFEMPLTPSAIVATWEGESKAVRFLPVCRDRSAVATLDGESMLVAGHTPMIDDYMPFISARAFVEAVFAQAGYTMQSHFFTEGEGRNLYFSGSYTHTDTTAARLVADFHARRRAEQTATADSTGRVYCSPSFATHSVGCFVDTASPTAIDDEENVMDDCFAVGRVFAVDSDGYATFTAPRALSVAMFYHFAYRTDFRIASRSRLTGFDHIRLVPGVEVESPIANTYRDYRDCVSGGCAYRCIVFNHRNDGRLYRLKATLGVVEQTIAEFSTRSAVVTLPEGMDGATMQLYVRTTPLSLFLPVGGDWAMYAGHVEEQGSVERSFDVRTQTVSLHKGERLLLDKVIFSGAEQGMSLTLHRECSLSPRFSQVPGYGDTLHIADIAPRHTRQIAVIESLAQMYDLIFHTDHKHKQVVVEPRCDLLSATERHDWSDRIDLNRSFATADIGLEEPRTLTLAYRNEDVASTVVSTAEGEEYGSFTWNNSLCGAKDLHRVDRNRLFSPSVSVTGVVASAPSAKIICVGDIGSDTEEEDASFSSHIVRYEGLVPLPAGEQWALAPVGLYPFAAFHSYAEGNNEGFTLSFADRDGIEGLHRYHDYRLSLWQEGKRLIANVVLAPTEVAALQGLDPPLSMRGLFRLRLPDGRVADCRIEKFAEYSPRQPSVTIEFSTIETES